MSKILKSLKQLDEATSSLKKQTSDEKLEMKRMVNRKVKSTWLKNRFLPVLLVILLPGVIWAGISLGAFFLAQKPVKPLPVPTVYHSGAMSTSEAGIKQTGIKETDKKKETVSMLKMPSVVYLPQKGRATVNGAKSPAYNAEVPLGFPAGEQRTVPQSTKLAERIPVPGVNFEGIIWDIDPAKRYALISGEYLKEGESKNGITLLRIRRDSITLKEGDRQWMLVL